MVSPGSCSFGRLGRALAGNGRLALATLVGVVAVCGGLCGGLASLKLEVRVEKLWVESGGRLDVEGSWTKSQHYGGYRLTPTDPSPCLVCRRPPAGGVDPDATKACLAGQTAKRQLRERQEQEQQQEQQEQQEQQGQEQRRHHLGERRRRRHLAEATTAAASTGVRAGTEVLIINPIVPGSDVITREILTEYLELMTAISTILIKLPEDLYVSPNGGPITVAWNDICTKVKPPEELAVFSPVVPCTRVTALDCFQEGKYDSAATWVIMNSDILDAASAKTLVDDYGVRSSVLSVIQFFSSVRD